MFVFKPRPGAALIALVMCLTYGGQGQASDGLYRKIAPSTAYISKRDGPTNTATGTGFLIDAKERLLITARHVVETKDGIAEVVAIVFAQSKDGEIITESEYYRNNWQALAVRGKVVYESVRRDMAVIQLEKLPDGIKPLELAEKKARPGQTIHVIGNSSVVLGGMFNYCQGHVRNTFRYVGTGANVLATHAPTNRGDSGGPVVNNLGEVVGFCSLRTGPAKNKADPLDGDQLVDLSICVSEIRVGLQEMRTHLASLENPAKSDAAKTRTFKGEAKTSFHLAPFEKDVTYRILVKAEGFTPEVRIDKPNDKSAPTLGSARGTGTEVQMLFTATESLEHRLTVGYAPGGEVGTGPFRYSLTIDQAKFEPEKVLKEPQLKINEHVKKFEAGKLYDITVTGKGFEPDLQVVEGGKTVALQFNTGVPLNGGTGKKILEVVGLATVEYQTTLRFVPAKTADYRILIAVSPYSTPGLGNRPYTMRITEPKADLSLTDKLTVKDPLYPKAGPHKIHMVKLQAGKTYQMDLLTTAFDARLILEDSGGKALVQGLDAEGFNSRLVFRPTKTDNFRIVVTSSQLDASGAYRLMVAESPATPPAFVPNMNLKDPK